MVRIKEAAMACGVSRQTIMDYVRQGKVFAHQQYGVILIDLNDAKEVSEARREMREKRKPKRAGRRKGDSQKS